MAHCRTIADDSVGNLLDTVSADFEAMGIDSTFEVIDNTGVVFDSDGDGVSDSDDAFPSDPSEWIDTDGMVLVITQTRMMMAMVLRMT